jgi:hypothetical protein
VVYNSGIGQIKGMVIGLVAEKSVHMAGIERVNNVLLLLELFIALNALGFGVNPAAMTVGTPIGSVSIVHLYTLFLVVLSLIVGNYSIFRRPNGLSLPLVVLFLLFFGTVLVSFGRVLFVAPSFTSAELLKNALQLHTYFYFIPLVLLIKNKRQLWGFVKGAFVMSVLAAVIALYQSATGSSLAAARMITQPGYHRFLFPTLSLMAGGFYTLAALYITVSLRRRFVPVYLLGLLLLSAILVPLHRNTMAGLAVVLSGMVLFIPGRKSTRIGKVGLAALVSGGIIAYVLTLAGIDIHVFPSRIQSGFYDLWHQQANAGFRFQLLWNTWADVLHNYPLLGRGFDWVPLPNFATYLQTAVAKAPTGDNGFASILIMFGLFGILVYSFVFYRVFKCGIALLRSLISPTLRALVIGIIALNAHILIIAMFEDNFSGQPGTTVLVASWALLYLMLTFRRKEQLGGGSS